MSNKKMAFTFGVMLIVAQLISLIGMLRMDVGLYPDDMDVLYFPYMGMLGYGGITLRKLLYAIPAGLNRFFTGFGDLLFDKSSYRVMSPIQITSAMIRYSLEYELGGLGLIIYDVVLTVSYFAPGISGYMLLKNAPNMIE